MHGVGIVVSTNAERVRADPRFDVLMRCQAQGHYSGVCGRSQSSTGLGRMADQPLITKLPRWTLLNIQSSRLIGRCSRETTDGSRSRRRARAGERTDPYLLRSTPRVASPPYEGGWESRDSPPDDTLRIIGTLSLPPTPEIVLYSTRSESPSEWRDDAPPP